MFDVSWLIAVCFRARNMSDCTGARQVASSEVYFSINDRCDVIGPSNRVHRCDSLDRQYWLETSYTKLSCLTRFCSQQTKHLDEEKASHRHANCMHGFERLCAFNKTKSRIGSCLHLPVVEATRCRLHSKEIVRCPSALGDLATHAKNRLNFS